MTCLVMKFGGTSVARTKTIKHAAQKVFEAYQQGHRVVVVVSAMAGETNRLLELSQDFQAHNAAAVDVVLSAGEQVTTGLMVLALEELGMAAKALQGWQVPIVTSSDFSKARIDRIPTHNLDSLLSQNIIPVIPGFQGVTPAGEVTTFGRGGSDVTAVVLAAVLKAEACHLYKDVPGILSSDPNLVENPKILDRLGVEEMFEMASQGAKVVHARAMEAALVQDVDLKILPTFEGGNGSEITKSPLESQTITGIVCNMGEVRIVLQNIPLSPGATACLFEAFATAHISLDMILQGDGLTANTQTQNLTFTLSADDKDEAVKIAKELQHKIGFTHMDVHPRIAKVSLVGAGLRGHAGVAHVLHQVLADLGISLYGMITTELKMSVLVSDEYAPQLVKKLHEILI